MAGLPYLPKSVLDTTDQYDWTNTVQSAMSSIGQAGAELMQPVQQHIATAMQAAMPAPPPPQPQPAPELPRIQPFSLGTLEDWGMAAPKPQPQPAAVQQPAPAAAPAQQQPSGMFSLPPIASFLPSMSGPGTSGPTGATGPAAAPPGASAAAGTARPAQPETLGAIEEGKPEGFFRTAGPYARQVEQETGVPAALSLAIAANETGYGQRRYMAGSNNFHGIQARAGEAGAVPYKDWRPGPGGQQQFYDAAQRSFDSPLSGFRGFAQFLTQNPRYAPALAAYKQTGDVNQLAADIHKAGYAEDPAYAQKITSIMKGIPVSTGVGEVRAAPGVGAIAAAGASQRPQPAPQAASPGLDVNGITKAYAGVPYTFGGPGGRGQGLGATTDCSGFVSAVWKSQYGLDLPAHTDTSYNALRKLGAPEVSAADARPGDVVYYMGAGTGGAVTHHMGIISGPGRVLDMSVSGGDGVRERNLDHAGRYVILRDPRVGGPPPQQRAEVPPPIVPSGVAEQSGGQRLSRQEINAASQQPALVSRTAPQTPAAGTAGAEAIAAAPQPTYTAPFQDEQREPAAPPEPDTVWSAFRAVNGRPPTGQELMALVSRVYGGLGG